ncbi:MAG: alpha/beta fold hydrolase [Actinobacteria bacterium]|nr:alpha/beta fold hydrolase [Actinomycetota bacterium]NCG35937.1 alpha/beta fold hydrolase [Actinomycetota bacterium]
MSTTPPVSKRTASGTAYKVAGPADANPIVLIHGLGLSHELWADHSPTFEATHRVVSYDLYGHGESAPPATEATLAIYAAQIVELLDDLGLDSAAIVGFSIGGMINRRLVLDYPDRVSSLVILNSPHDRGAEAQLAIEARAGTVRQQGAMSTMDAALKRWFTPGHLEEHPEHEQLVRRWRNNVDPEGYAQATWALAHGVRELVAPSPPIRCPTLVMTCEHDSGSTPAMAHAIAAETAGAETIVVDRLQHLGLMEAPSLFIDPILDFLERHAPHAPLRAELI